MPMHYQHAPPYVIVCRTLSASHGITAGQMIEVSPDRAPEEGDLVAVNINGFSMLAEYKGDHVTLHNGISQYEFNVIGVLVAEDT